MIKKICAILMTASMITSVNAVFADVNMSEETHNIYIAGTVPYDNSNKTVSVLIQDGSGSVVYMKEFPIEGLSYECKFKFNPTEEISNYKIKINAGGQGVENGVITAISTTNKENYNIDLNAVNENGKQFISASENVGTILNVQNFYADNAEYKLITAYYTADNKLIGTRVSDIEIKFDTQSVVESELVSVAGAEYSKSMLWDSLGNMYPLSNTDKILKQTYGADKMADYNNEITIVAFGASVLQGAHSSSDVNEFSEKGWAALVRNYYEEKYKKVNFYNSSIGGTNSTQALYRLEQDCLKYQPDLIIMTYPINDQYAQSREYLKTYLEGIMRMCINQPHQAVIVMAQSYHTETTDYYQTAIETAEKFGIKMIDFESYAQELIKMGSATVDGISYTFEDAEGFNETFLADTIHPNELGHKLYAEYFLNLLEGNESEFYKKYDTSVKSENLYEFKNPGLLAATDDRITYSSGWTEISDPVSTHFPNFEGGVFSKGVMQTPQTGETAEFEFSGKSIGIYVKRGSSGGKIYYDIDNGKISGSVTTEHSDTRPYLVFERHDLEEGVHAIKITTEIDEGDSVEIGYFALDE